MRLRRTWEGVLLTFYTVLRSTLEGCACRKKCGTFGGTCRTDFPYGTLIENRLNSPQCETFPRFFIAETVAEKFEKMSSPVQVVIAALLIYVCWLLYKLVRYSLFNAGYLENFGNPKTLYYFHMNGCGHCKKFSPTWDQFASKYNGNVQLKKLERAEAGGLLEKYDRWIKLDRDSCSQWYRTWQHQQRRR